MYATAERALRTWIRPITILATAAWALPGTARADEAPTEPVKPVELSIGPAAEPIPALRYRFHLPAEMRQQGNAAPIYLRIVHERGAQWHKRLNEIPDSFLEGPVAQMPLDEVRDYLDTFSTVIEQLSAAARRSDCQWEYALEGQDPLMIILNDAQVMRAYARLLAIKARYEIRTGDLDAAVGTIRDGVALGRNVARGPFLVNQLIGIATCNMVIEPCQEFIQRAGAPNLYWALASLPRPLVSLDGGLAMEAAIPQLKFPELADLEGPRTADQWQSLARSMRQWAGEVAKTELSASAKELAQTLERTSSAPSQDQLNAARAYLRDSMHMVPARVEAMPDAEVEVRYTAALHREITADWQKWFYLPYSQGLPRLEQLDATFRADAQRRELYPLTWVLWPKGGNILKAQARLDRRVAILMAIEALRMHLASTGKLPDRLDEVTAVPVPPDPVTGGSFQYQREGDIAVLDVADTVGMTRDSLSLPARIKVRAK